MSMGLSQPLTEISTRIVPGVKGWLAHTISQLFVHQLSRKCGSLDFSQPYGLPWPVNRDGFITEIVVKNHTHI
jgi:hypothetical protein